MTLKTTLATALTGAALTFGLCPPPAVAGVLHFSGALDDSTNTALVGSAAWAGNTPAAADFADVANNVALYTLSVTTGGTVRFVSTGLAAGGVEPYFSLFGGTGAGATFIDSNDGQAFSTGGDFSLNEVLAAGDYTLALGAFANMSFAENQGTGSLGDGFIGLGESGSLGNARYALDVTLPDANGGGGGGGGGTPLPEPHAAWLSLAALAAALGARARR